MQTWNLDCFISFQMQVLFIDQQEGFVAAIRGEFAGVAEVSAQTIDVTEVPRSPGTAFVSPANSLGFMDGGIDMCYSRVMWPGIESHVKRAIHQHGQDGNIHARFLPIGQALAVLTSDPGVHLIVAPTMLLPQDVNGTMNAYWAFRAALGVAVSLRVELLVVPGLCTGVGRMSVAESAAQIRRAWTDGPLAADHGLCLNHQEKNQPNVYANTAFYP